MAADNALRNEYEPDEVSPPGDTLAETLEFKKMDQAELARRTGRSPKMINEIIKGKAPITSATAIRFERVLGIPASFWINRDRHYQEFRAREAEEKSLASHVDWLKTIPLKAMVKAGWIRECESKVDQLQEALGFFRIASPDEWSAIPEASFRRSARFGDPAAVAAWLRRGENVAEKIECAPFDLKLFRVVVREFRSFTVRPIGDVTEEMVSACASAGVALVYVPQLPKTSASGATRWLNAQKALIQLSLRYKKNDQFWFTLFHEAAHILLGHSKKAILVSDAKFSGAEEEDEANRFAAGLLIPKKEWRRFLAGNKRMSRDAVLAFASEIDIAPGIVVGRLQHEKLIPFSQLNGLKQTFQWVEKG